MRTPNIYDIKRQYQSKNPEGHYFDSSTIKFFGVPLRKYKVTRVFPDSIRFLKIHYETNEFLGAFGHFESNHYFDWETGKTYSDFESLKKIIESEIEE